MDIRKTMRSDTSHVTFAEKRDVAKIINDRLVEVSRERGWRVLDFPDDVREGAIANDGVHAEFKVGWVWLWEALRRAVAEGEEWDGGGSGRGE